jgi:hypothetical protein
MKAGSHGQNHPAILAAESQVFFLTEFTAR